MNKDIDALLKRISECRISIQTRGGYSGFYAFVTQKFGSTSGFSKANLSYLISELQKLKTTDGKSDKDKEAIRQRLKVLAEKVHQFDTCVQEFLDSSIRSRLYLDTKWYVYFFYHGIDQRHKVGLGRTVMSIDRQGTVFLENVRDGESVDYKGNFKLVNGEVLFFNLEGEREVSMLHIKALAQIELPELILGAYLNYEVRSVRSGTILMELRDKKEKLTPGFFNSDCPEFHETQPEIRKYLARKSQNVLKIPKSIFSIKDLRKFLREHTPEKMHLFFDPDIPRVFISSPTQSIPQEEYKSNASSIKAIIAGLNHLCQSGKLNIKIDYPGRELPDLDDQIVYRNRLVGNFRSMKLTKYFFLVLDRKCLSKSLIELGWALAHCKIVTVYFRYDLLNEPETSEFINGLNILSKSKTVQEFELIPFFGNLHENIEPILKSMFSIISNHFIDTMSQVD